MAIDKVERNSTPPPKKTEPPPKPREDPEKVEAKKAEEDRPREDPAESGKRTIAEA